MVVETEEGTEHIEYCCPFALLWLLSSVSVYFGNFLRHCVGNTVSRIIMYCDGIRPGTAKLETHSKKITPITLYGCHPSTVYVCRVFWLGPPGLWHGS